MILSDHRALFHADRVYDPRKAHEYYLRTRKLKGRRKGSTILTSPTDPRSVAAPVKVKTVKAETVSSSATKQAAQARVEAMKVRLERLQNVLEQLVEEAKARSGVEKTQAQKKQDAKSSDSDTSPSQKSKEAKGDDPLSALEKLEAAKRAKEYRRKHKTDQSIAAQTEQLQNKIKLVQNQIKQFRSALKSSVEDARPKSNAVVVESKPRRKLAQAVVTNSGRRDSQNGR